MFVRAQGLGEVSQEQVHCYRGYRRQDEREFCAGGRFDGGENIGPVEAAIAQAWRTLPLYPPAMTGASFLPDPGFILEKQTDAFARMRLGCSPQSVAQPFF